jgi:signal peptidase
MSAALPISRRPQAGGDEQQLTGTATASRSGRPAAILRRVLAAVSTTLVVTAVAAFLLTAVGPRVFGYHTLTMLTGSMAPLIEPGDVVVTTPVPTGEVGVGDIITYHIPVEDQRVETHRVTELSTNADGTIVVQTKGDANNGVDPWLATINAPTVDRHVLTVPYVGQIIRAIRQPVILNTLMYGAPAVLVVAMLVGIWRRQPGPAAPAKPGTTAGSDA